MRIAAICDRMLRDYLLNTFAKHPEMDARIVCFPALKSVDVPEYEGVVVLPVDRMWETNVDAVLIATFSAERKKKILGQLEWYGKECCVYMLLCFDCGAPDDVDFIQGTRFNPEYVCRVVNNEEGRFLAEVDADVLIEREGKYIQCAEERNAMREELSVLRRTADGLSGQTRAFFDGRLREPEFVEPNKMTQNYETKIAVTCVSYIHTCVNEPSGHIFIGGGITHAFVANRFSQIETNVIGTVGDDIYGRWIINALEKEGIGHRCVHVTHGGITATLTVSVNESGERYFKPSAWREGAYNAFALTTDDIKMLQGSDYVITYGPYHAIGQVIDVRKATNFKLVVDFSEQWNVKKTKSILPWTDIGFFSGKGMDEEDALRIIQSWSQQYVGIFVLTLGERGSVACFGGQLWRAEAEPVECIKSTGGCGDTYIPVFTCTYARTHDIPAAMKAASLACKDQILLNNAMFGNN